MIFRRSVHYERTMIGARIRNFLAEEEWTFAPHERPALPGSPGSPEHPPIRRFWYGAIGVLVGITGGLGNAMVSVNTTVLQGSLGLDPSEIAWLPIAYMMTNASINLLLIKFRLLRRAVSNLIENAIKYGGHCSVQVKATAGELRISLRDRGPGVDPSLLDKIEEPFFRAEESRNRQTGGTGLGLAIVRSIVDLHNGSLTLENLPEGGFSATITLFAPAE